VVHYLTQPEEIDRVFNSICHDEVELAKPYGYKSERNNLISWTNNFPQHSTEVGSKDLNVN
jgi:hypothetical protein